jgi:hypothetical protein
MASTNAARATSAATDRDPRRNVDTDKRLDKPTLDQTQGDDEILLAAMRCGVLRLRLLQAELEEAGLYLRNGAISSDDAIAWLHSVDAARFCQLPPIIEATGLEVRS